MNRERKILRICQAHVAPGMSLIKWQEILAAYAVFPDDRGSWSAASDDQVNLIFEEIAGVVRTARADRKEVG